MFKKTILALCVSMLAVSCCETTRAQDNQSAGWVVVLDVAKVFKANADFDTKMQTIRKQAESLQATFKQEQEAIGLDAQALQGQTAASEARYQLEAQLEQRQTALKTKARQAEAELLAKEAQIYFDTYQKMQQVVTSIAQTNGIVLVLRFDSEAIDPANRGEVIKGVNRAIVFHKNLDITDEVIRIMGPVVSTSAVVPPTTKK